jgi:hypothetical protein
MLSFIFFFFLLGLRWNAVRDKFNADKEQIERSTFAFIDNSFKQLRSAEDALELLQNFKQIEGKSAISQRVLDKFDDILDQFSKVSVLFCECQDAFLIETGFSIALSAAGFAGD